MTNEGCRGRWPRALLGVSAVIFGTLLVDVCRAATITVNTQNMAIVFDSQCGLREAVEAVNQGFPYAGCLGPDGNDDRIVVPAGTYTTQEVMDVYSAVTIAGAGREQTIVETGDQYGFGVYAGISPGPDPVTLGLEDLTLRKAQQAGPQAKGIYVEGGVTETAALRLDNVRISSYTSDGIRIDSPNAQFSFEDRTAILHGRNCLIDNNTYAGIQSVGATSIVLEHCRLTQNSGSGMVLVNGPTASLWFSIVDGNTNIGNGGGINVTHDTDRVGNGERSHFELNHSAVFDNHATGNGGGVYFQGEELATTHVTISGNTAQGFGGGLFDARHGANSYTRHFYVTVVFNDAASGGGCYFSNTGTGTPDFKAALVAQNTLDDDPSPSAFGTDFFTPFQITAISSVFGTREGWRDFCDTVPPEECGYQPPLRPDAGEILDPGLGPLDYYGGPTPVHPLLPGSPAIDSTNALLSSTCTFDDFGSCSEQDLHDQRGFIRPGNGNPILGNKDWDAGAFELQCGASAQELVTNQGFESGTSGWVGSYGTSVSSSTAQARSGSRSLRVANRNLGTWQGGIYNLLGSGQPGETLQASGWVRIGGDPSEPVLLTRRAVCQGGTPTYQTVASGIATNSGWTELSGTADIPNCNLTELTVYFEGPRTGVTLYIDDVSAISSACENLAEATLPIAGKLIATDDWGTGYCMELRIENPNSVPTTDWLANFNLFDSEIYTIWNLNSTSATGPVTMTPTQDWNRIIAAQGESHSLGFCANRGVSNRTCGVTVVPNLPGVTQDNGVGVRAEF